MAKSVLHDLKTAANRQAQCAPGMAISRARQVKDLREHADKLERQEKTARKEAKRRAKAQKQYEKQRARAFEHLERIARGNNKAAVQAAQALMHNRVDHTEW